MLGWLTHPPALLARPRPRPRPLLRGGDAAALGPAAGAGAGAALVLVLGLMRPGQRLLQHARLLQQARQQLQPRLWCGTQPSQYAPGGLPCLHMLCQSD
jgi:hypothetical protein